ncbi:MAG TPA: N-acetylneuraminate synthase [Dongiaceae bacterium]
MITKAGKTQHVAARSKALIICEAGVNHNGSEDLALQLIDAAADAGADIVKFQTFRAAQMVSAAAPKAAYQDRNAPEAASQLELLQKLELPIAAYPALLARCAKRGIEFLSTPFDLDSLRFLVGELGLARIKVSSGDVTNAPLLLEMARSGADIIVSTGMCSLGEIEDTLGVLAFGYLDDAKTGAGQPNRHSFAAAYRSDAGRSLLAAKVTLLHCTSDYPAQPADVNLRAMDTLSQAFGLATGYSDHTLGLSISLAAIARGACVIEKHMTLDRDLSGPDHKASLEPRDFAELVRSIRAIEAALGSTLKAPTEAELSTRQVARKSIVAARPIAAGERFTTDNLTTKRVGGGISPIEFWDLIGAVAPRDFAPDEAVSR